MGASLKRAVGAALVAALGGHKGRPYMGVFSVPGAKSTLNEAVEGGTRTVTRAFSVC